MSGKIEKGACRLLNLSSDLRFIHALCVASVASMLINSIVVDTAALEAAEPVQDARGARVRVFACVPGRKQTHLCGAFCR
jgi:hypothetical protein